jgi:hypothetical protein
MTLTRACCGRENDFDRTLVHTGVLPGRAKKAAKVFFKKWKKRVRFVEKRRIEDRGDRGRPSSTQMLSRSRIISLLGNGAGARPQSLYGAAGFGREPAVLDLAEVPLGKNGYVYCPVPSLMDTGPLIA